MYYWRVYSPSDRSLDVRGTAKNDYCARLYVDRVLQILIEVRGRVPEDIVRAWSGEAWVDLSLPDFVCQSMAIKHLPHHPMSIELERRKKIS